MTFDTAAAKSMESVVHNDHLYRVPSCSLIGKTMTVSNLVFELFNNSFDDVISPWKLRILKVRPNEVHL